MVNPLHVFAALGGQPLKRQVTTSWSSVISTSFSYVSEPTSITIFGYYGTYLAAAGTNIVTSTYNQTTSYTFALATSPLTETSTLDPACSSNYAAFADNIYDVQNQQGTPLFQVGYAASCLPTGYGTVTYYSPGICPTGYTLGSSDVLKTSNSKGKYLETQGFCCFDSFTLDTTDSQVFGGWQCVTYFNPPAETIGSSSTTANGPISEWTVTAEYLTATLSTSSFTTAIVSVLGTNTVITDVPDYTYTYIGTATELSVISGGSGATIVAPLIEIRWQSSDSVVLSWLKSQSTGAAAPHNSTAPSPPPQKHHKVSAGAIAGIAIGGVAVLGLIIGALIFFLCKKRRNKRQPHNIPPEYMDVAEAKDIGYSHPTSPTSTTNVLPKSELDSRSLSPTQFSTRSNASPPQGTAPKPFISPVISELPGVRSPDTQSIAGYAFTERPPNPQQWNDEQIVRPGSTAGDSLQGQQMETDMHGFLMAAPGPAAMSQGARSSWLEQQQRQVREEKARLMRLQELSEMDARLEEQIQRELAEGQ